MRNIEAGAGDIDFTTINVQEYIAGVFPERTNDNWDELHELAGLTALRIDSRGGFYVSNFWRGPMLYALVRALKPKRILELGTGRGYGAFCMAKAFVDGDIDGKLVTVDRTPGDVPYDWAYVNAAGQNEVESVSLNEFWGRHLPGELRERIELRCGDTAAVHELLADGEPGPELVFIDGDHTYHGVALDFLSSHAVSAPNAVFVFDDYSVASGYGIRRLINEDISRFYSVEIIDMELTAEHDISVDHKMAVCNGEAVEVLANFTVPGDMRFRYLKLRRWFRGKMISVARLLGRR